MPTARPRVKLGAKSVTLLGTRRSSGASFIASTSTKPHQASRERVQSQSIAPLIQSRYLSWGSFDERRSQSTYHSADMTHQSFPSDLPIPHDDGLCSHLPSAPVPSISLPIARSPSSKIDLSRQPGLTIILCYPRTGAPNETVPDSWNAIPGARGCTPQACSFRDKFSQITSLGVSQVFGVSTQSPEYQAEVHERLHLPYDLLSDQKLELQRALKLPTFDWEGRTVLRRVTLAVEGGMVVKVWYPVFPPDKATEEVVGWLTERAVVERGPPSMIATDHVA